MIGSGPKLEKTANPPKMSDKDEVEEHRPDQPDTGNRKFHGVYLLYCLNSASKGKTYIGYTVNPTRRIKQHNLGKKAGGAYKTSGRGPWEMVLITHGFPTDVSALRFEWAWQHPASSRRLKHLSQKLRNEKQFEYRLRILSEMLRTGPWDRLPLTIQWLKQEYARGFPAQSQPPLHMPLAYGPIRVNTKGIPKKQSTNKPAQHDDNDDDETQCHFCGLLQSDSDSFVNCCSRECSFKSHIVCLAESREDAASSDFLLPISIQCPECLIELLWGDLVYGKTSGVEQLTA